MAGLDHRPQPPDDERLRRAELAVRILQRKDSKYLVFQDPEFDYSTYDFDDYQRDAAHLDGFLNATSADLTGLKEGGGKLLLWHGWSDAALTAYASIDYFEEAETRDASVRDYFRFYLMPGVFHCAGGPGPDRVDWLGALEQWVEQGSAPSDLLATKVEDGRVAKTRPPALCLSQASRVPGATRIKPQATSAARRLRRTSRASWRGDSSGNGGLLPGLSSVAGKDSNAPFPLHVPPRCGPPSGSCDRGSIHPSPCGPSMQIEARRRGSVPEGVTSGGRPARADSDTPVQVRLTYI